MVGGSSPAHSPNIFIIEVYHDDSVFDTATEGTNADAFRLKRTLMKDAKRLVKEGKSLLKAGDSGKAKSKFSEAIGKAESYKKSLDDLNPSVGSAILAWIGHDLMHALIIFGSSAVAGGVADGVTAAASDGSRLAAAAAGGLAGHGATMVTTVGVGIYRLIDDIKQVIDIVNTARNRDINANDFNKIIHTYKASADAFIKATQKLMNQ